MKTTTARTALLLLAGASIPLATACSVDGCGEDGPPARLEPGSYRVALDEGSPGEAPEIPSSSFPHAGRDVSVRVDREAGKVYASWTNDEGALVVETWLLVER